MHARKVIILNYIASGLQKQPNEIKKMNLLEVYAQISLGLKTIITFDMQTSRYYILVRVAINLLTHKILMVSEKLGNLNSEIPPLMRFFSLKYNNYYFYCRLIDFVIHSNWA